MGVLHGVNFVLLPVLGRLLGLDREMRDSPDHDSPDHDSHDHDSHDEEVA